jgi:hypothetical protein
MTVWTDFQGLFELLSAKMPGRQPKPLFVKPSKPGSLFDRPLLYKDQYLILIPIFLRKCQINIFGSRLQEGCDVLKFQVN